jgi:hydrogenase expression/formation protein HypC
MSAALPGCIIELDGDCAMIDIAGLTIRADVGLIDNPQPGDWLLLHRGVALTRINAQAAADTLAQLRALDGVK